MPTSRLILLLDHSTPCHCNGTVLAGPATAAGLADKPDSPAFKIQTLACLESIFEAGSPERKNVLNFSHHLIAALMTAAALALSPLPLHAGEVSATVDSVDSDVSAPTTEKPQSGGRNVDSVDSAVSAPTALSQPPQIRREESEAVPPDMVDSLKELQQDAGTVAASDGTDEELYNDVYEEEDEEAKDSQGIYDPIAPFNKVMFQVNDRLYFWLLKPAATGYSYLVPQYVRAGFSSIYDNLKSPGRMINSLLQFRLKAAGTELFRFVVNTTVGVAGFKDIAADVLEIRKQDADFGQTLGHYGIGHGFYIVWPVFGPSSLRDTVGFAGDSMMHPLTYAGWVVDLPMAATFGIAAHQKVNDTSFKIGEYESFLKAVVDPYTAMRDSFVQYRKKKVEESDPLFKEE